jgi:hypothetical protein
MKDLVKTAVLLTALTLLATLADDHAAALRQCRAIC